MSLQLAFSLLLARHAAAWRPQDLWQTSKVAEIKKTPQAAEPLLPPSPILLEGETLQVCECEDAATTAHGGLQCEKEGWFIYSFDAVGRWVNGGGQVPLSSAKCCRICVPKSISETTAALMPAGAEPTAIVSVGCHSSTEKDQVTCETNPGTTFVTGFQRAVLVPSLASITYFPEGPVTCCAPVLMLSTGDAWEIERCNCKFSMTPGCDGESLGPGNLLWGYSRWRDGGDHSNVPIAPAKCCQACLGTQVHRLDQCRTLNRCSHHGVCVLGSCQCHAGWGGPDCSEQLRAQAWPPLWFLYVLMLACVLISVVAWLGARTLLNEYVEQRRQAAEEHATLMDPLIVAEGDIGEYDTDGSDTDDPGSRMIQMAHTDGADAAAGDRELTAVPPASAPAAAAATAEAAGGGDAASVTEPLKPEGGGDGDGSDGDELDPEEAALQAKLAETFDERRSPLSAVKCSICFDRAVQVVLVPCGHSNLCRRCARRVEHCPYCRKPIARRQRLYLADDA